MRSYALSNEMFLQMVERLVGANDPGSVSILLESQLEEHPSCRFSIYAADPSVELKACGDQVSLSAAGKTHTRSCNPWDMLREVRASHPGWYFGYLGYDLKNHCEKLVSHNTDLAAAPDLFFFRPETLLIYDHRSARLIDRSRDPMTGSFVKFLTEWPAGHTRSVPDEFQLERLTPITGEREYLERIRVAKRLIREGEFYEINLSHVLQGSYSGHGFELYRRMKQKGPVPFGAYLKWDGFTVCSASPERFLCREGSRVYSQPIKGTAARQAERSEDEIVKARLLNSEKERAENLMIVDLVRNDLSRISLPGTIRVPELCRLQSFETVHQLISTVEGRVSRETDSVDILRACFPMGSMTGAPKIRAMQAIEELEDYKRGIYSGAVGYIGPGHDFDFNVVIRTALLTNGKLFYPVGGAITSDSDPREELSETYVKARALTLSTEIESPMK